MPSSAVVDAVGAVGGGLLAACLAPQLLKLYTSKSARDLSYLFLSLYTIGLVLSFVYLYYEDALVAWVCMLIELAFSSCMVLAKYYLDNWGPKSWRAANRARPQARLTNSPSLAAEIRIDVQEFTAGKSAPFPLLRPQPSHAAQHLLLDAHLALPAGAVGGVGHGKGGSKRDCSSSSGSGEVDSTKPYGGTQPVLSRIGDILEAALAAAGLPVQRRQFGAFPSFRRRPSQARQAAAEDGAGPDGKEHEGSGSEEEGGEAPPDMLYFACRDGYATAIWYSDTATLSLDLLAASDAAVECMGDAAQELCEALVAEFPGSRMTGSSVARLPRQQQQQQ